MNEISEIREAGKRYLLLAEPEYTDKLEENMIGMISGNYFIAPRCGFRDGSSLLCYDISRFTPLKELIGKEKPGERFIKDLFGAIYESLSELEGLMLSDDNLSLSERDIYISEDLREIRFILMPAACVGLRDNGRDVYDRIRRLCEFLLRTADTEERDGILLLCRIYQASSSPGFCMSRLAEMIGRKDMADAAEEEIEFPDFRKQERTLPEKEADLEDISDFMERNAGISGDRLPVTGFEEQQDEAERKHKKTRLGPKLLMAMGIMSAAALTVILIRGIGAFVRLLPAFLVLCAAICLYFILGHMEEKIRNRISKKAHGG